LEKDDVNEEVPKLAAEHAGKYVAVEWQDGLAGGGSCGAGGAPGTPVGSGSDAP
jgi:hypothetical protein